MAAFVEEITVTVNVNESDLGAGSVEAQVAQICEQAQAEGLQLTGAGGLLPDIKRPR